MYLFPSTITAILAFSTLVCAIHGSLSQRKICIPKGEVCHKTGETCCDGFKCALAHGGKADVGYCTESGLLLQDYYQSSLT